MTTSVSASRPWTSTPPSSGYSSKLGFSVDHRNAQLISGPMEVPVIGRRIAFVTDNVGTVIELSGPLTSSPGE